MASFSFWCELNCSYKARTVSRGKRAALGFCAGEHTPHSKRCWERLLKTNCRKRLLHSARFYRQKRKALSIRNCIKSYCNVSSGRIVTASCLPTGQRPLLLQRRSPRPRGPTRRGAPAGRPASGAHGLTAALHRHRPPAASGAQSRALQSEHQTPAAAAHCGAPCAPSRPPLRSRPAAALAPRRGQPRGHGALCCSLPARHDERAASRAAARRHTGRSGARGRGCPARGWRRRRTGGCARAPASYAFAPPTPAAAFGPRRSP